MARSSRVAPKAQCIGCGDDSRVYDQVDFVLHAHGCGKLPTGNNCRSKHEAAVAFFHRWASTPLARSKGTESECPPKLLSTWGCRKCGRENIPYEEVRRHNNECKVALDRQGPDWVTTFPDGSRYVYDYTDLHVTCPSYRSRKVATLVEEKMSDKRSKYVATGMVPHSEFVVVLVYSYGGLHDNTLKLIKQLAKINDVHATVLLKEFSVLLQRHNGAAVLNAHRASARRAERSLLPK